MKVKNFFVWCCFLIVIGCSKAFAFQLPVSSNIYVPGSYGGRNFLAAGGDHLGEDIALVKGTPIKAVGDGTIVIYRPSSGYGELVCVIEHNLGEKYAFINGNGDIVITQYILSIYGHIRKKIHRNDLSELAWQQGDNVSEGDIIGYVNDDAHNGDGAEHLHMGIRLSSKNIAEQRDPGYWFRGYNRGTSQYIDFAPASKIIEIIQQGGINNLCKKYDNNPNIICWQPASKINIHCSDANERRLYRNMTGEIIIVDNSFCPNNDLSDLAYSKSEVGYGYGGGGSGGGSGGLPPVSGDKTDLTPDFDIYNEQGQEISSNNSNDPIQTVQVGQRIKFNLTTEVHNDDVDNHLRDNDSNSIEGPVYYWIDGVIR